MPLLSTVNHQEYVKRCLSSVVAYWVHTFGVMGSNAGQVKHFFSFLQPLCFYFALYKNYKTKLLYFPKIYNYTSLNGPNANYASIDPTSQVCSSAMLVLLIVGN
jgi:hypothetical protein